MECQVCHAKFPASTYLPYCDASGCGNRMCDDCFGEWCHVCRFSFCKDHRNKCSGCSRITCGDHVTTPCLECGCESNA